MALYTPLDFEDIVQLTTRFGIIPCNFRPLRAGVENTGYRVTSLEGEFALLVLEKRDVATAELYTRYLRALLDKRLPVPQVLACGNNRHVTEFAGKPVIMVEYIHGEHHNPLPAEYLSGLGITLAKLHTSGVDCPLKPFIRFREDDLARVATFKDVFFREWLMQWYDEVADVVGEKGTAVATHGDPFPDNLIITGDNRIFLIDWEDGAHDSFLVDLGMAVLGLCCVNGFHPDRLNRLLAGYRSRNTIPFGSRSLLRWTIYVALFTAYRRYLRQETDGSTVADNHSYLSVPRLIDSVIRGWGKVIL